MVERGEPGRDLAGLVVPLAGRLVATGDRWEPYRLVDGDGVTVGAAGAYFGHLQAAGRSEATVRSYGMDLLRWFRFLWAAGVAWDRASRAEARDFCRWLQVAGKPVRPHWRDAGPAGWRAARGGFGRGCIRRRCGRIARRCCAAFTTFTWRRARGRWSIRSRWTGRAGRAGACAPQSDGAVPQGAHGLVPAGVVSRIPRSVPDEEFNEIFAALPSHRDRALVAFYVSTGARASELLSATRGGVDPGRQLITVVRKGTREVQQLPASADAFVWLRLYQLEMDGKLPRGSGQPLWWTLRRPFRPLGYHAAHRMFERAGAAAGTDATLHALRHTAAYRMAEDPGAAADRRAVRPGSRAADHHAAVPDAPQGGRDPPGAGPPRRAGPPGPAAGPARPRRRATGPRAWMCCSGPASS